MDVADLPPAIQATHDASATNAETNALSTAALSEMERMTILRVFEQVGGDKALAGKLLGISRATLYRKLKLYGIPLKATEKTVEREQVTH
jgi:transcriptional regulator of acetoin/glycerol metabolism